MKRKIIRLTLGLLLLLGLPLAAWRMYFAHVINQQLAQIHAAGLPTNGEELNRWYPAAPDNQNAALVLTQAFALLKTINASSDARAEAAWKLKDKFPRRADLFTPEQADLIRWYVETNQPALEKARAALALPACRYPIDCRWLMSTELPHLAHLVNLANLNQCRAALAILDGQKESSLENIETILALARTLDAEPCLISQLVRLRMVRMAFTTLQQRAEAGAFTQAELVKLNNLFTGIHTTNVAAFALIGDRALTIPYFRMTKSEALRLHPPTDQDDGKPNSPLPCHGPAVLRLIGYYELDYGSFLIGMNKAIALLSNTPPHNLRAAGYFSRVGEESTKRRRTLSGQTMSAYASVPLHENEAVAHQRLALTALAVENYRNETGGLPKELEELVPKYFAEVPEDPFTGLGLEYRRTKNGYALYSVGRDRQDNGGLEQADKKESDDKKSYDITFIVER
ncbi:MAG: hypothetical protein EPO07_14040 [Verrucomicrobia bacterium]|nr:MAG: hypothetical protein EPO07_14040 [Verrucomicrobiota bacterium]